MSRAEDAQMRRLMWCMALLVPSMALVAFGVGVLFVWLTGR